MVSVNKLGHEYDLKGQVSVAPWGEKKEYHVSERQIFPISVPVLRT